MTGGEYRDLCNPFVDHPPPAETSSRHERRRRARPRGSRGSIAFGDRDLSETSRDVSPNGAENRNYGLGIENTN